MKQDYILVLDYGSQYNQLIVRRVRELGVYAKLVDHVIDLNLLKEDLNLKGIILSGGPSTVYEEDCYQIDQEIYNLDIPILGICYGMQLTCHTRGGEVTRGTIKEFGKTKISVDTNSRLFKNTNKEQIVWMSHLDKVVSIPNNYTKVATSLNTEFVAVENHDEKIYGIQFHPEVTHSEFGMQIINNFLDICEVEKNWSMDDIANTLINNIKNQVKDDKVLCALSGGVDSSVVAFLLEKAIGKNLTCVFVDHGLLRKDEAKQVVEVFSKLNLELIVCNEQELFYSKLDGISDPEQKRKIIGSTFIEVFDRVSNELNDIKYLAQGTLYTDIIESGTKNAQTIKSHHNVGGLPKDMKFELIEPVNELFKDEVRALGKVIGVPDHIVNRQPFPGPGLGIRIMNNVTQDKVRILQEVDAIVTREIEKQPNKYNAWQYFAVLVGCKSVGVVGDQRRYGEVVAVRAVSSIDGMSADFCDFPYEFLSHLSTTIINEVDDVARVVYDITSKPPGTIEWE